MKDKIRKCIACQECFDRDDMFRIMQKYDTKEVILSPTNKDFGRSIYICKKNECVSKAFKKGKINHVLKVENLEWLQETLQNSLIN